MKYRKVGGKNQLLSIRTKPFSASIKRTRGHKREGSWGHKREGSCPQEKK